MIPKAKPILFFLFYILLCAVVGTFLFLTAAETSKESVPHTLILNSADYQDHEVTSIWEQLKGRVRSQPFNLVSLVIFSLAIIHTFLAPLFTQASNLLSEHLKSTGEREESFLVEILRFMGEVEVIFGIWVIPLMIAMTMTFDWKTAIHYLNNRDYTEAIFVVVIMSVASTKPVLKLAEKVLSFISGLGGGGPRAWWLTILTIAPFLGSFITEPAAMTIAALLLSQQFYRYKPSTTLAYATLGLLFTNISVGGVFTNFAAPPVLLVRDSWNWDSVFMFQTFGLKAIVGIIISNTLYLIHFWGELGELEKKSLPEEEKDSEEIPFWITIFNVAFLAWIVIHSHYPVIFVGAFLVFLGFWRATHFYQGDLSLQTPILVGLFLAGLVVHGSLQGWWISPILGSASKEMLMVLAMVLTAFNDNAEITFLATLIPDLSDAMKYSVVAGAVAGGGLTVIANAPNPAGQTLLQKYFPQGVSSFKLFLAALLPTLIMGSVFYLWSP